MWLVRIALVLGFIYYLRHVINPEDLGVLTGGFNPGYLLLCLLSTSLMLMCRGNIWMALLELKASENLRLYSKIFAGMMANVVLPARAGDFYKAWWSREVTGREYPRLVFLLVVEKIIEGAAVLLILLACFAVREGVAARHWVPALAAALAFAAAAFKREPLRKYCRGFGYGMLVRLFSFLSFYFFMGSISPGMSAFDALHINNIAALGAFVAVLPAGLLTYQAAAAYGFSLYGQSQSYGLVVSGAYHLVLIVTTLISGLASIALFEKDYWATIKALKKHSPGESGKGISEEV